MMDTVIRTERLTLRPIREYDCEAFFAITRNDHALKKYISFLVPDNYDNAKFMIDSYVHSADIYYVILYSGKLIGLISCTSLGKGMAEIAYFIGKNYRKKGFMTEALESFLAVVAKSTSIKSTIFGIKKSNGNSKKIMEKFHASKISEDESYYTYTIQLKL